MFGHPDNYIRASALVTPAHIVPEWYFLPFYAMLKSFPSKLGGAICMVGSMVILFSLPWTTENYLEIAEPKHRPLYNFAFMCLIFDMLMLGWLGGKAVTETVLLLSQLFTAFYWFYFVAFLPLYSQVIKQNNLYLLEREIKAEQNI
jgi:ubiquinol-cytochrome c reductase cytochrome b subunit